MKTNKSRKNRLTRLISVSIFMLSFMTYKLLKREPIYGMGAHIWIVLYLIAFFIALFVNIRYDRFL